MSIKTKINNITGNMFWETAMKGRNIPARGNALGLDTTALIAPRVASTKRGRIPWGNILKNTLMHHPTISLN